MFVKGLKLSHENKKVFSSFSIKKKKFITKWTEDFFIFVWGNTLLIGMLLRKTDISNGSAKHCSLGEATTNSIESSLLFYVKRIRPSQQTFTCTKLTVKTLEKIVIYVHSQKSQLWRRHRHDVLLLTLNWKCLFG